VALSVVTLTLGGCYAYATPPPAAHAYYVRPGRCVWVPAHYRGYYNWSPGHWQC
jgi:hypothetical protein